MSLSDEIADHVRRLGFTSVGTETILLALTEERMGIASNALAAAGVRPRKLRMAVEDIIGRGKDFVLPQVIPYTPRAKRVLELAWEIARELGDHFVGPEHLLLGVIKEAEGAGAQALVALGVDMRLLEEDVRRRIGFRKTHHIQKPGTPLEFKTEQHKHQFLRDIQGKISAWQNRAWMAKQQGNDELVRQALERKWEYEKRLAEARDVEPPAAPQDGDDLFGPSGTDGGGAPPMPSGVPRKQGPRGGDAADAVAQPTLRTHTRSLNRFPCCEWGAPLLLFDSC